MTFNSEIHRRRSIRLLHYDYSHSGRYFVTVYTQSRECLFGGVVDRENRLNEFERIARNELLRSIIIRRESTLDEWVIMPNHLHAIVRIDHSNVVDVGAHGRAPLRKPL